MEISIADYRDIENIDEAIEMLNNIKRQHAIAVMGESSWL